MRSLLPLKNLLATRKDEYDSLKGFLKDAVFASFKNPFSDEKRLTTTHLKVISKDAVFASFKNPFSDEKRRTRLVQRFFKGCGLCFL
jgi:hypothetical protein